MSLDLHQNELQNAVVQKVSDLTDIVAPVEGQIASKAGRLYIYNGSTWFQLTTESADGTGSGTYVLVSSANAENTGWLRLDSEGGEVFKRLYAGNADGKLLTLGATLTNGQAVFYDGSKFIGKNIASVMNFMGVVDSFGVLPSSGVSKGDVYNVVAANGNTPAGTNYVWDGSAWDALGGTLDITGLLAKAAVKTDFSAVADDTVPSTKLVKDSLDAKVDIATINATAGQEYYSVKVNAQGLVVEGVKTGIVSANIGDLDATFTDKLAPYSTSDSIANNYITKTDAAGAIATATTDMATKTYVGEQITAIQTTLSTEINKKANDADLATVAKTGAYSDLTGVPVVDAMMSASSENAVQNKAIQAALDLKADASALATARTEISAEIDADVKVVSNALASAKTELSTKIETDVGAAKTELQSNINEKADQTALDAVGTRVTTLESKKYALSGTVTLNGSGTTKTGTFDASELTGSEIIIAQIRDVSTKAIIYADVVIEGKSVTITVNGNNLPSSVGIYVVGN